MTNPHRTIPTDPVDAHPTSPGRRRLRRGAVQLVLGLVLCVTGAVVLGTSAVAPDAVERIAGSVKVDVQKVARKAIHRGEYLPEIRLGGEGDLAELDACDGTFTELVSYRSDGVLPLFAAHNNCGGDIILGWDLGQQVRVEGSDVVYEVVEERHTPRWSNTERLQGMRGEFMVQTCYYGENRMRFLSLAPLDPQPPAG